MVVETLGPLYITGFSDRDWLEIDAFVINLQGGLKTGLFLEVCNSRIC